MRFIISLILIKLFSLIAGMFLPWWSIALVTFLVGLMVPQSSGKSLLAGFLGIFLLWGVLALVIDIKNERLLSQKIALLFKLGEASYLLIPITAFIGALVGGLAAWSGALLRRTRR